MYRHCLDNVDDPIVKARLSKKLTAFKEALSSFITEYDRYLADVLEANNLDKVVRRKCDGAKGILKIVHDPRNLYVPAHYAFYRFRKDGEISTKSSGSCGSLISEITLYYEPDID